MRITAFIALALAFLSPPAVFAQSTATPVVTGYNSTSGCPAGLTVCFVQFGAGGAVTSPAPYVFTSTGFSQISVSNSAVGISPPAGSTVCFIQTETQAVRYRTDGTNPTAAIGMPLATSVTLQLTANLSGVKFIAQTGTATLDVDCYK